MVFYQTMTIRRISRSKGIYIPNRFGFRKGDWVHVEMVIKGRTYHHTAKIGRNDTTYIIIPMEWDVDKGDIVDTRINLVTVPTLHRDDDVDADTGTKD